MGKSLLYSAAVHAVVIMAVLVILNIRGNTFLDVLNMLLPPRAEAFQSIDLSDEDADPVHRNIVKMTNQVPRDVPSAESDIDAASFSPFYAVDEPPTPLSPIDPAYPADAEKNGVEGQVLLRIYIDEYGKVRKVETVRSPDESLSRACIDSVMRTRFKPARIKGKNRAVVVDFPIRFTLK